MTPKPPANAASQARSSQPLSPVSTEKVLKDLMVGLVYPAVLGSIMYTALQFLTGQAVRFGTALWADVTVLADPGAVSSAMVPTAKVALLLLTLGFYGCDFLYILFTNRYRALFFFADIVFVICLYLTVAFGIRPDDGSPPDMRWITFLFLVFMFLYLLWDKDELQDASGAEQGYYRRVINWESDALFLLLSGLTLAFIEQSLGDWRLSTAWGTSALFWMTWRFGQLSWEKRCYVQADRSGPELQEGREPAPAP
jgi:hypothetical protein